MVLYKCPRCGYETKIKTRLTRHLNRQFACEPKLKNITIKEIKKIKKENKRKIIKSNESDDSKKYSCPYCSKKYSRMDSLQRHIKYYCKEKSNYIKETELQKNIILKETITLLQQTWEEKYEKEKDEIFKKVTQQVNILSQNYCHNTYNTNTINVNNFGCENIEHISQNLLTHYVNRPGLAIPNLINKIHFDPTHPENHNLKTSELNKKVVQVNENNTWVIKDRDTIIQQLIDEKSDLLQNHFNKVENNLKGVKRLNFLSHSKSWDNGNNNKIKKKIDETIVDGSILINQLEKKKESNINTI